MRGERSVKKPEAMEGGARQSKGGEKGGGQWTWGGGGRVQENGGDEGTATGVYPYIVQLVTNKPSPRGEPQPS